MEIREYNQADEVEWLRCRLLSFYDTSYCEDVIHQKPSYTNACIDLVAVEDGVIVGFIEVEIEQSEGDACHLGGKLGGVIWNIAVLNEYRQKGIASKLLEEAISRAKSVGVTRFEAWTQEDEMSNQWYVGRGFKLKNSYLNVYANHNECLENRLISKEIGSIYGVRALNFEVPTDRKEEIRKKYTRYYEVRLYELIF